MKRSLLIITILFSAFVVFAQNKIANKTYQHLDIRFPEKVLNANQNTTFQKSVLSDWYDPLSFVKSDSISGIFNSLTYSINFLQSDSLAKIVDTAGNVTYNQWLSAGQILDPKDTVISFTSKPYLRLSNYVGYTFDSISFSYLYVRNKNQITIGSNTYPVTDTLFIGYFINTEIHKYSIYPSNNKFASVDWRGDSVRMPINHLKTDTIFLSIGDTTGVANVGGKYENYFNLRTFATAPSGFL